MGILIKQIFDEDNVSPQAWLELPIFRFMPYADIHVYICIYKKTLWIKVNLNS